MSTPMEERQPHEGCALEHCGDVPGAGAWVVFAHRYDNWHLLGVYSDPSLAYMRAEKDNGGIGSLTWDVRESGWARAQGRAPGPEASGSVRWTYTLWREEVRAAL